jgi:hypothetical protein
MLGIMNGMEKIMSDTTFFIKGRNRGNERKCVLSTPMLLVGKAPAKQKRIKLKLKMILSGKTKVIGMPEWVTNAFVFVSQNHDPVQPQAAFSGFNIDFSDDTLFKKGASAVKAQMKGFYIAEEGDSEEPDVAMTFTVYTPFSTALWEWCGQFAGEEQWVRFEQIETEEDSESEDLELSGQEEEPDDPEEDDSKMESEEEQ